MEQERLAADAGAARQLAVHLEHGRARWLRLRDALAGTLAVLADAGIEATVFKGAHTARTVFAEPGLRPMADLDVRVHPAAMDDAERALSRAGYVEQANSRLRRPRRSDWHPPGAPLQLRTLMFVHAEDPYTVDLHASLDVDFFGVRTVSFGPHAQGTAPAPWLGPNVSVLAQPLLAAYHAVHASHGLHGLTLLRQVELVLLLRRDMRTAADWSALRSFLRAQGAQRFAFPAFTLVERLAPGTVEPQLLHECQAAAPPRLRDVVARLEPTTAQRLDSFALEERFMWAAGPLEHLRRVGSMLLPPVAPRELHAIYTRRAFQLMRRSVSWRRLP